MIIIDYINRLLGKPPILPNGYPDVAQTVARRINGGDYNRFYIPPPPAPMYPTRREELPPPMVAEIINKIQTEPVRTTPSSTSSLWCGTTVTDITSTLTKPKDPYVLDHKPLKRMLMKLVPWILDITEVRVREFFGTGGHAQMVNGTMSGQLEIHITVSSTHHTELMNPQIEIEVRKKLFTNLLPLVTCMYENSSFMSPIIIFSPSHSETILEHVK
jgi:hypothetical protein